MKPSLLKKTLRVVIKKGGEKILLVSAPGMGKTSITNQICDELGVEMVVIYAGLEDVTMPKGIPWIAEDRKSAHFVPFDVLERIVTATKPLVVFLDDFGWATPAVQSSFANLIAGVAPDGRKIPSCVTWIAATNRRQDKANVTGILEPVKSRFSTILHLEADLEDFCNYAIDTNQPIEGIAYLRFQPEMLNKFEPSLDMVNSPCPRTWFSAFKFIDGDYDEDTRFELISGAVGQGAAAQFVAFLKMFRQLPSLDGILLDPDNSDIPEEISTLYAVSTGLAAKATQTNFKAISKYANRMLKARRGEFATLLVRDATRRDKKICNTPAFIALTSGELGQLIAG